MGDSVFCVVDGNIVVVIGSEISEFLVLIVAVLALLGNMAEELGRGGAFVVPLYLWPTTTPLPATPELEPDVLVGVLSTLFPLLLRLLGELLLVLPILPFLPSGVTSEFLESVPFAFASLERGLVSIVEALVSWTLDRLGARASTSVLSLIIRVSIDWVIDVEEVFVVMVVLVLVVTFEIVEETFTVLGEFEVLAGALLP